jgi:tryptophan synthase alpha chain
MSACGNFWRSCRSGGICRRGEQNFISACADSGVDGLVIPDLPVEESGSIRNLAGANGIDIIQLIAPASTIDRIIGAAKVASGFIYCVSRNGVTGARKSLHTELSRFLGDVRSSTEVPLIVGFGISQPEHARQAAEQADGVIVGSALIAAVDEAFKKDGETAAINVVQSFLIPFRQALDHTVAV